MADRVMGTRNDELAAPTNASGDSAGDSALGEVVPASVLDGF